MVDKKIINEIVNLAINKMVRVEEKCQPDYITSLPYARATTVEEVDKRIEAIDSLIEQEEKNLEENIKKLEEYDNELVDIWDENKELESQIEELQGIIDAFHEEDEREVEQNREYLSEILSDLSYSYIPDDLAEELYTALNDNLFNMNTSYIDEDKKERILDVVNRINDYADNIRPSSIDYSTIQDVEVADSMTNVTSDVVRLINPSYSLNVSKQRSDNAEIELGELIEIRGLNESRENEITINQNRLYAEDDKSEIKINKLTEEKEKQERKKEKIKAE